MILERMVFRLKFGKAKEVKALMKESKNIMPADWQKNMRSMFDLTGPSYTFVMETTYENLTAMEKMMQQEMPNAKEMGEWYQKFSALVDSSYREMFTITE
ncbi:MAG: hypothetical protein ABI772_09870 [Bacteroidota bacterium]